MGIIQNTPVERKYYIDKTKLWAYTYILGLNELEGFREELLKEFGVSDQEVDQFDPKQYVTDFINGDLISLEGPVQSYETQKRLFAAAIKKLQVEYGLKNIHVNEHDIWQDKESLKKGRFFELFSALQKEGFINLKGFSYKDGIVFDVTDKLQAYISEQNLHDRLPISELEGQGSEQALRLYLSYDTKTRDIKINGIFVSRPNFDSPNHSIIEILYEGAGTVFNREQLQKELRADHMKSFNAFLNEIGIKGTIRKYLFRVSKENIGLIREITVTDRDDFAKISKELTTLKSRNR